MIPHFAFFAILHTYLWSPSDARKNNISKILHLPGFYAISGFAVCDITIKKVHFLNPL
jgi:hypothetical protein